jgi:hypothetical protein
MTKRERIAQDKATKKAMPGMPSSRNLIPPQGYVPPTPEHAGSIAEYVALHPENFV